MVNSSQKEVGDMLTEIRSNGPEKGERELVFDPVDGQIMVVQEGKRPSPDAVPAGNIAHDGFFR